MNKTLDNPIIDWCQVKNHNCLKFTFREKLTEKNADIAIERWTKLFDLNSDKKIILIWHCIEMTGYEPMARIKWQKAIKMLKDQIDCIWLVSNSKLILTGARIMSFFTSFKINITSSEDKILLN